MPMGLLGQGTAKRQRPTHQVNISSISFILFLIYIAKLAFTHYYSNLIFAKGGGGLRNMLERDVTKKEDAVHLEKRLGLFSGVALIVGTMIGKFWVCNVGGDSVQR